MASAAHDMAWDSRSRADSHWSFASASSAWDRADRADRADEAGTPYSQVINSSGGGFAPAAAPHDDLTPAQVRWSCAAFMMVGVGVAMCWTMLQCGITYFARKYSMGTQFYLAMMAAYNIPVLPLLLLQAALDRKYDVRFGAEQTFQFRFTIGFLFLSGILCAVPFVEEYACLMLVVFAGVMDSVAFGTAAQLFSMFPARCGGYYFIGASVTSLLSLAITIGSGFARETPPSDTSAVVTYALSAVVILLGLLSTLGLVRSSVGKRLLKAKTALDKQQSDLDMGSARDIKEGTTNDTKGTTNDTKGTTNDTKETLLKNASDLGEDDAATRPTATEDAVGPLAGKSNRELFTLTMFAHLALGLTWLLSTFVGSLVSYVPSHRQSSSLKLVLVYVGMFASLCGKQLNALSFKPIRTQQQLFAGSVLLAFYSLFYFFYVVQGDIHPKDSNGQLAYYFTNDWFIIVYLALFNMVAAYLSSNAYGMAAALVPGPSDKAQNSALLGVTLMVGVYVGLGSSFGLSEAITAPPV